MRKYEYKVAPDPDQPGKWYFMVNGEGSDISYDSEEEALEAAGKDAIRHSLDTPDRRVADRIDGYDRDDLGESPDY